MIIILLLAAIFGFILSSTLFFKKSTSTFANRILGSFYFLLSVYALQAYIIDGGFLEHFKWFFLWPLLPYHLLFIPIYYYYKIILTNQFKWYKAELILLIPFVLGVIDVGYVYFQPESYYNDIISQTISNPKKRLGVHYWLLDLDQHLIVRNAWQLGVLLFLSPKIWLFIKKGDNDEMKNIFNKWLIVLWSILTIMALLTIVYALEKMELLSIFGSLIFISENSGIITFLLYIALFLTGVIPIYFPDILHRYPQQIKSSSTIQPEVQHDNLKFGLNEQEVLLKLESLKRSKLYLKQNFNLTECANQLQMPSHHITYFLKRQYELSFAAYKNSLRMEHAKKLIEDGYLEQNTIEALASECGFANRTSFSKAFKVQENVSPSQYGLILR
ncbi:Helix-turn-helix domain-containing protein [Salegentibacter holothuriorum]|uniref:Helix-turn-helix domain-containing protein n=1 Tax=Salegentibacter holothuriorum TaxID=241145 RepID=A0A1T5E023_9FLAO|nr:AraC family transcriptional regulator [Salegentibacter holothuriorum]SKB77199.1 Helix-turn-helix domain-containing protein [Salegentibacter holothuriorum]